MKSTLQTVALVIIAACAICMVVEHRAQTEQTAHASCLDNVLAHQNDILNHGGTVAQQNDANAKAIKACNAELK